MRGEDREEGRDGVVDVSPGISGPVNCAAARHSSIPWWTRDLNVSRLGNAINYKWTIQYSQTLLHAAR